MKLAIFTVAALFTALLYVPKRDRAGDVIYTWVFDATGKLDVFLLLLELAMIGLLACVIYALAKALN